MLSFVGILSAAATFPQISPLTLLFVGDMSVHAVPQNYTSLLFMCGPAPFI